MIIHYLELVLKLMCSDDIHVNCRVNLFRSLNFQLNFCFLAHETETFGEIFVSFEVRGQVQIRSEHMQYFFQDSILT